MSLSSPQCPSAASPGGGNERGGAVWVGSVMSDGLAAAAGVSRKLDAPLVRSASTSTRSDSSSPHISARNAALSSAALESASLYSASTRCSRPRSMGIRGDCTLTVGPTDIPLCAMSASAQPCDPRGQGYPGKLAASLRIGAKPGGKPACGGQRSSGPLYRSTY